MALKKQDVHTLYGTAETRAEDEAWKIASEHGKSAVGRLEAGDKQWDIKRRVVDEAKRNGFVAESHPPGYVRLRKGEHVIEISGRRDGPDEPVYHEYMYANLKRDDARDITAMQAVEIARAVGRSERNDAALEVGFQRHLREVQEKHGQAQTQKSGWKPDEDWRARAVSQRAEERTAKQSMSQKL